jgi:formiminotetrahydrofolate cyclodeaminase
MAAGLVGMVVQLTQGRPGTEGVSAELDEIGGAAASLREELLHLTDLDAEAYRAVVAARRLPKDTESERAARSERITEATRGATLAPLRIAQAAAASLALAERLAPIGNPNAVSDVGVAALLAVASARGAALNVRINLPYLRDDDPLRADSERALEEATADVEARASAVHRLVEDRIG